MMAEKVVETNPLKTSPKRNLAKRANTSKEIVKQPPSPSTNRVFMSRNNSKDNHLNSSLNYISDLEKRVKEDKLLKEVYGIEQRAYSKIPAGNPLPSSSYGAFKRRLNRPRSQVIRDTNWSPYKSDSRKDISNSSQAQSIDKLPQLPQIHQTEEKPFRKILDEIGKDGQFQPHDEYLNKNQELDGLNLSNNSFGSSLSPPIYAKTTIRDTVFDPITGEIRKYSVDRSPSRSLGNKNPELTPDISYGDKPNSEKFPSHNRSFSYGDEKLLQPQNNDYLSSWASRAGSSEKSLYRFQTNSKIPFSHDLLKMLNPKKIVKGMGYQRSKIFY
ncbi:unnamed protein product [Blepharisma stoltei]|uniref:Uncharacterized protein n=1 Tax=Blepharisma stoltei TaxID=1481888 RepID=A0AAU9J8N8_9CILI|nr:unnamed protein product [Blepharisma stoltei]